MCSGVKGRFGEQDRDPELNEHEYSMSTSLVLRCAQRRLIPLRLLQRRAYQPDLTPPPPPTSQPAVETFSQTSRPRPYYARPPPPRRDLPKLQV
jgi:hypothetical protein